MKKAICILMCTAMLFVLVGCRTTNNFSEPSLSTKAADIPQLPLRITETSHYRLSLVDAYIDEEYNYDDELEYSYIFKFEFENKHESSNIRAALVDAEINGYSLKGSSRDSSDTSFSVYTWSGHGADNTALDTFVFSFEDIEAMTNIRDAKKMSDSDLSFTFRVYVIDEMDDYGEDMYFTIEDAFLYCYRY